MDSVVGVQLETLFKKFYYRVRKGSFHQAKATIKPFFDKNFTSNNNCDKKASTEREYSFETSKMAPISISPENPAAAETRNFSSDDSKRSSSDNANVVGDGDRHNSKNYSVINFLKIYFDFTYFVGCTPFHFTIDRESNSWYLLKTWKPQQVFCALLHSIGMLRLTLEVRRSIPSSFSPNPEQYFEVVGSIIRILFKALAIKRVWMDKSCFLEIVNFIFIHKSFLPKNTASVKLANKYLITLYCLICCVMPIFVGLKNFILEPTLFTTTSNSNSNSTNNGTWWNRERLVADGRSAFFIKEPKRDEVLSPIDYFLAILMAVGILERLLIGFLFDAGLLLSVLTLWATAYSFSRELRWWWRNNGSCSSCFVNDVETTKTNGNEHELLWRSDLSGCFTFTSTTTAAATVNAASSTAAVSVSGGGNRKSWSEVYSTYKCIRLLSFIINQAYGSMVTLYVAESILYHSMNLDRIVLTDDVMYQVYLLFFIVTSVMMLIFSADICKQMESLKTWLSKDESRKNVPLDELNMILFEMNSKMIGIKGSEIFTITYSLVWNLFTTVVTYFIICVQSRGLRNDVVVNGNNLM